MFVKGGLPPPVILRHRPPVGIESRVMLRLMAVLAEILHVRRIHRDLRIGNVERRQEDLVMQDLPGLSALLTKPEPAGDVPLPELPP